MAKAKAKKSIVKGINYHNGRDYLFMMTEDDFRFNTERYPVVEGGTFDSKTKLFTGESGAKYKVFGDWSVSVLSETPA